MLLLNVLLVTWVFVGMRALQNLNILYHRYTLIALTSLMLAMAEVFIVKTIAHTDTNLPLVLALAAGGFLGCLSAIRINEHLKRERK